MKTVFCVVLLAVAAQAEIFFQETFDDASWTDRWVQSNWKQDTGEAGTLELTHGEWYGDETRDLGLQTSEDARFYAYSSKIEKPVSNEKGDLVVQLSVKHEQKIDCGGGYIKLLTDAVDLEEVTGDSEYRIMFGPDICGTGTKRVHTIFNHEGENLLIEREVRAESDQLTHVYTLIVHEDSTYEIRVDGESKQEGSLYDDWKFEEDKEIDDPEASKPEDWVDDPYMDDPEDVKPEGWDDIPAQIVDPEAEKPDDWDDDSDGEWEAPTIDNPEFKGEWRPKRIENPDYTGPWEHPKIPNPDYVHKENVAKYNDIGAVAIEVWQVKSGTIFDNILITDSVEEAEKFLDETYGASKDAEKEMFDKAEEERKEKEKKEREEREAERKAQEEADAAAAAAEEEGVEDDDEDDDDEGDDEGEIADEAGDEDEAADSDDGEAADSDDGEAADDADADDDEAAAEADDGDADEGGEAEQKHDEL